MECPYVSTRAFSTSEFVVRKRLTVVRKYIYKQTTLHLATHLYHTESDSTRMQLHCFIFSCEIWVQQTCDLMKILGSSCVMDRCPAMKLLFHNRFSILPVTGTERKELRFFEKPYSICRYL